MTTTAGSPLERTAVEGADRGPTAGDPSAARSLHHITVVTPEGVVLEFRAAGIASRMIAITVDVFLQFVLLIGVIVVIGFLSVVNATVAVVSALVLIFLVFWGYPALLETFWGGRTVGKRLFRLRVLTVEGGPIGFRHAAIRALLGLLDFWIPAPGGLVALVTALVTRRSQRVGDLAAGTIVVREPKFDLDAIFFNAGTWRREVRREAARGQELLSPMPDVQANGLSLDAGLLQPHHYALAREFLIRAPELLPRPRHDLGVDLADRLAVATGNPRPPDVPPEPFLQSLLHAYQQRSRQGALGAAPPPTGAPAVGAPIAAPPPTGPPLAVGASPPMGAPIAAPPPTGPPPAASPGPGPTVAPIEGPGVATDLGDLPMPSGPPLDAVPPPDAASRVEDPGRG
ncbi:MAG: RDD family protein [Actinomycetota bacterium]